MNIKRKMQIIGKLQIGSLPKAILALVVLEIIPAIDLELFEHNASANEIINILSPMGLSIVRVRMPEERKDSKVIAILCISPNPNNTSLLENLVWGCIRTETANPIFDIAYGALMGYPLSAIEGYITNQKLPKSDYPHGLDDEVLVTFMLSKERWQEEASVIMRWRDALAKHAPHILEELDSMLVR